MMASHGKFIRKPEKDNFLKSSWRLVTVCFAMKILLVTGLIIPLAIQ